MFLFLVQLNLLTHPHLCTMTYKLDAQYNSLCMVIGLSMLVTMHSLNSHVPEEFMVT
jgi:hypothetical protein